MKVMAGYRYLIAIFALSIMLCTEANSYTISSSECLSQDDCGSGECCVFGMIRYSTAQCMSLGQVNDYCREFNPPENRTLYFPNGDQIRVKEAYTQFCPCGDSLQCTNNVCTVGKSSNYNNLYSSPKMISHFRRLFANT